MNLMLAVNDKYCMPAKVMLVSFLENNKFERHNIYFLYGNVNVSNIDSIKRLVETYDASFNPIEIQEKEFEKFPMSHHFSIETYYRFLAQKVLPEFVDRVLWLDADMIINKSIKEFYYQDFEGKHLVVCKSINNQPEKLLEKLELPKDTIYFNAGTILFNLKLIRQTIKPQDYFNYIEKNREKITWLDQDVLNAIFSQKTKIDNLEIYNKQIFSETKFVKEEKEKIEKETAIIHYIGAIKPWHYQYENFCKKYYRRYAKKIVSLSERTCLYTKGVLYTIRAKIKKFIKA